MNSCIILVWGLSRLTVILSRYTTEILYATTTFQREAGIFLTIPSTVRLRICCECASCILQNMYCLAYFVDIVLRGNISLVKILVASTLSVSNTWCCVAGVWCTSCLTSNGIQIWEEGARTKVGLLALQCGTVVLTARAWYGMAHVGAWCSFDKLGQPVLWLQRNLIYNFTAQWLHFLCSCLLNGWEIQHTWGLGLLFVFL